MLEDDVDGDASRVLAKVVEDEKGVAVLVTNIIHFKYFRKPFMMKMDIK